MLTTLSFDDDDHDADDEELCLWSGCRTKVLTIVRGSHFTNLWQKTIKIWTCAETKF